MNLPLRIALRYLFAKKSHNVINIISAISAIGMAVGTAALVIILSVYNGFDSLVRDSLGDIEPDLLIEPSRGKVFVPEGEAFDALYERPDVATICSVLEENVFVKYGEQQGIAKAKGVDSVYEEESALAGHVIDGEFVLHHGSQPLACLGAELGWKLGVNPYFVTRLELFFPSRSGNISLVNPAASIESIEVKPSCLVSVSSDVDAELVVVPIETMRELLDYKDEVSAVELRFKEGRGIHRQTAAKEIQELLGDGFTVKDRFAQNSSVYKMMRYEKVSIFLILIFVIIIIAFNVFGSLSMLIIEKKQDIATLRALGARNGVVQRIFVLEGWLITLLGLAAGLVSGIAFVLIQQQFGLIKMPGNFLVAAYPVILNWKDIALTAGAVALIGYLIARIPVSTLLAGTSDPTREA